MIAFDDKHRYPLPVELAQHDHRVICGLGVEVAAVEKVARYHHEIDAAAYGVALDHLSPGAEKIARAVGQVVSLYAEMNVGYVKKSRHILIKEFRSQNSEYGTSGSLIDLSLLTNCAQARNQSEF
jgi:hypothetical protein